MKTFPITRKQFGEFITRTKGKGSVRGDSKLCPLTRAIQAARPKAKVTSDGVDRRVTVDDYNLPAWGSRFIQLYDGHMDDDWGYVPALTATAAARKVGAIK